MRSNLSRLKETRKIRKTDQGLKVILSFAFTVKALKTIDKIRVINKSGLPLETASRTLKVKGNKLREKFY